MDGKVTKIAAAGHSPTLYSIASLKQLAANDSVRCDAKHDVQRKYKLQEQEGDFRLAPHLRYKKFININAEPTIESEQQQQQQD